MARNGLVAPRPSAASSASARILDTPCRAQVRAQVGEGGRHRAAVGQSARGGEALRDLGHLLGLPGPTQQRVHQRAVGHDRRGVPGGRMTRQPGHPPQDGTGAAARPHRAHERQHQPGDPVGVTGGHGVLDRFLRPPVLLEPGGGSGVQRWHLLGEVQPQFGEEVVAQQVVVAVPPPAAVQGEHQHGAPDEVLQPAGAARRLQDGVAQRSTQPLEHRGPHEEVDVRPAEAREQLGPEVVGHPAVVACDREPVEGCSGIAPPGRRGTGRRASPPCAAPAPR